MKHFKMPSRVREYPSPNPNRGARYVAHAKVFKEDAPYGMRFTGEELLARAQDKCPDLLTEYTRELTPSDIAKFLSLGGTNPAMGEDKFILQWQPEGRCYQLLDMAAYWNQADAGRLLGKQSTRVKNLLRVAKDMAADVYHNLPPEEQEEFLRTYEQEISDLNIVSHWGENEGLTLEGAVEDITGLKLQNGRTPEPVVSKAPVVSKTLKK